jgi:serine-type D-Ala-D-Ala carboxypeptidase/endopeptidase (penicillin-binding protein 4)
MRLAGLVAVLALLCSAAAFARTGDNPPAPGAGPLPGPDRPVSMPAAKPGSAAARRAGISGSRLRAKLAAQMRATGGSSGAYVVDLDAQGDPTLFSWASRTPRILASNMKLFTTAAFLDRYGAKTTFTTHLWTVGSRSGAGGRVLHGQLALVGAGDPTLADASFASAYGLPVTRIAPLANAVKRAGIRVVSGGIVADAHVFDGRNGIPQAGITGGPYLGSLSGLSYNSGYAGGQPAASPPKLAARALQRKLRRVGVKVKGGIHLGQVPSSVRDGAPTGAVSSPSVATLIAATNAPSNDFFAEMLLKRLAAAGDHRGTTARGARMVEGFASRVGSRVSTQNGSGLSRIDKASPRDVVHLLAAMNSRGSGNVYRSSLAGACESGTLAGRMCGTAAAGRCKGKTGTINGVTALSGYCQAHHHHRLAFSILMNGVDIYQGRAHQDRMAALLARYSP